MPGGAAASLCIDTLRASTVHSVEPPSGRWGFQQLWVDGHCSLDQLHPVAAGVGDEREAPHLPVLWLLDEGHACSLELLAHGLKVVHNETYVTESLRVGVAGVNLEGVIFIRAVVERQLQGRLPQALRQLG
eukprot:CAMPEP_0177563902 /NCGR_PEP_ID=MMETSP0369-20130122/73342_1 /TAXON_ID=447022 ORGANISM="Scrippsiella hangoei-like, Strain SHHI-4" /NCGR_SAMPLE_ID=MMETSP0369 /ASSEMBLY_ACC=CAM_ASM_000364 /LENGTH=130 /DNA_ID=CAMNT_0019051179 /DNA_START=163 /DNA_END=553 /DNA_ORIENTATION=-